MTDTAARPASRDATRKARQAANRKAGRFACTACAEWPFDADKAARNAAAAELVAALRDEGFLGPVEYGTPERPPAGQFARRPHGKPVFVAAATAYLDTAAHLEFHPQPEKRP